VTKAQTFNFLKITLKYIDFGHGLLTSCHRSALKQEKQTGRPVALSLDWVLQNA